MEIKQINGNLLDSTATYILHQVNCQGAMNSGVAKAIREKYPTVYEDYIKLWRTTKDVEGNTFSLLGMVLPSPITMYEDGKFKTDGRYVMNLFAQDKYGYDGNNYTSYDAIYTCLTKVAKRCVEKNVTSVALPYKMSSDRGGADWDVILAMIKSAFKNTEVTVEIWKLGQ